MCWWGCGWCVVRLVPRHSWLRFPCATPRHSWLGFAACGGVRFSATPGWGLLAAVVRGAWCVVCGVWCAAVVCWWGCGCGWSLATPGGGSCVLLPATPGWVSMPVAVGGPRHSWLRALGAVSRHSWLGFAGGGGVWWGCGWCVVCLVPRHSWRRFLCATPRHSWLGFAAGGGVRFPGHSWLGPAGGGGAWRVVCGVWCVVCGGGVWWVCGWCGWSLATPGGGSCVLLPATPGWVSMPVAVGGPRHSWLRALGAVPRHSWLGFAGGGGVWWGCGWCVVWLVPRHPWRSFLCATPRHSWLGFAAGGGVRFPASPGWGLLAVVVRGVWCVVCGGGVLAGLWVVCGVVGPSPLLAEVPVCYSPPLLAGFRCRWWWAVPATPGWGPLAAVVCGVWRWCVGCWSLATPGGGSCVLLPATPGWVSLPAVVGGVRCVVCGVWRAAVACVVGLWLVWLVPRHSWRRFLCATPRHSWLGFAAGGGGRSPPLLAGVRWRRWCVVCGGGVLLVGPSPLLAEVPVCYSPPLLAGFRCRWWWAVPATPGWGPLAAVVCGVWRWCVGCWSLATPGGGSCVLLPATPGWVSLPAVVGVPRHSWRRVPGAVSPPLLAGFRCRRWCVVCGVWCAACGVRRWRVRWVCGWCGWSLATPGGGSCVLLPATPGWVSLPVVVWCGVAVGVSSGCPSPWPWCVCVRCVALRVGVGGVGGGGGGRARCGCRACACVCSRCVVGGVGCVIPWLVLVVGRRHVSKGRRRGPVDA